jgi:hypothetical protein
VNRLKTGGQFSVEMLVTTALGAIILQKLILCNPGK